MIYLDYAATTPVSPLVLKTFGRATKKYIANPNSGHGLGLLAADAIEKSLRKIRRLLQLSSAYELVPTSGATEANNLAWQGWLSSPEHQSGQIITTAFEHSSITANANHYARRGYRVDILKTDAHGHVDLNHLAQLLGPETLLVSVCSVNSEIGNRQPIDQIKKMVRNYPKAVFHCDVTQTIGKEPIELEGIDLISLTAHKIYGIKGVGLLIKKKKVTLQALIRGGHSTTSYRRGTPTTELVLSMEKAVALAMDHLENNNAYVNEINRYARRKLTEIGHIVFNSEERDLPYVLNFSVLGHSSRAIVDYFSQRGIYISNHTACESDSDLSTAVLALTHDEARASSSIRISFAALTTKDEIDAVARALKEYVE